MRPDQADDLTYDLLKERFGPAVREWKPAHRTAPIAELLDLLKDENEHKKGAA